MLSAFVFVASVTAQAQESGVPGAESTATNKPTFQVDVRRDVEGTFSPYRYVFITTGQDKFTFLVPEGYRVDTPDPSTIKLASPDFSGLITVGLDSTLPAGAKMDAEALRARVLTNYPKATITAEQTSCANGQIAPALDFTWKADSDLTRLTRTTFIPTTAGLMEFTVTASPEKFGASLHEFNLVMLTFRSGVNGKFDYVIGSKYP